MMELKLFTPYMCERSNDLGYSIVCVMLLPDREMMVLTIYLNIVQSEYDIYHRLDDTTLATGYNTYSDFSDDIKPLFDNIFK